MGRRHKAHDESHENHERWLVTYSDLITLLLAFFIILYSMSNVDAEKYKQLASALNNSLGGGQQTGAGKGTGEGVGTGPHTKVNQEKGQTEAESKKVENGNINQPVSDEFKQLAKDIQKISKDNNLGGRVLIREEGRGLVLELRDSLLFETGRAYLSDESRRVLKAIGMELSMIKNHVRVEGHADNVPINTLMYPNNWHLSTARAMSVIDYWDSLKLIPPTRLSGAGYGEHRPIDTNLTPQGRAKNRRVDIVIIRNSVAAQEPQIDATIDPENKTTNTEGNKH